MTEEPEVTEEVVEATVEDATAEIPPEPTEIPAKEEQEFDRVDFTPAQQKRFNRLYAQVKSSETLMNQLVEDNKKLITRLASMEERTIEKEATTTLDSLKSARRAAREAADWDRVDEIDAKIDEFKEGVAKAKATIEKPEAVDPEAELPPSLVSRITEWAQEVDESDNVKRPFIHPQHPSHKKFQQIVTLVLSEPGMSDKKEDEWFSAVDEALEKFGLIKPKVAKPKVPSVLTSSLGNVGMEKSKLTQDQIKVAKRMFRNSPDPIEEYRKAMSL